MERERGVGDRRSRTDEIFKAQPNGKGYFIRAIMYSHRNGKYRYLLLPLQYPTFDILMCL